MKTKRYDDGGVTGSAGVPDTGIEAAPNYLSPNYQPARSVGRGVAVAQPSNVGAVGTGILGRSPFRTMDSFDEERGLLPGQITPMTGAEMQRVLLAGDPDSIGSKLATGYQQLFGRDIDPRFADFYLRNLQTVNDPNQPLGARSSQADINRILLGDARGSDREAAMDYQMSLTGGRPAPGARQFFQPVYQPEAYANYRQIPFTQTRAPSMFNQMGFNPFAFTNPSSSRDLRQMLPSGFSEYSPNEKINYFNQVGAAPEEIMRGDPTLTQEGLNWMYSQGYTGGVSNPYSRNVGSGVAVQRQMPQFRMPQYAYKQGGTVTDGIRAVRYLKR